MLKLLVSLVRALWHGLLLALVNMHTHYVLIVPKTTKKLSVWPGGLFQPDLISAKSIVKMISPTPSFTNGKLSRIAKFLHRANGIMVKQDYLLDNAKASTLSTQQGKLRDIASCT